MAKIVRYSGNFVPFGLSATGTKRTVFGDTAQSDTLDDNINAKFLVGWEQGVNPNGFPPEQYFNAVSFTSTQVLAYLHQLGIAEWHVLQEFNIGSLTNVAGTIYESLTDANIGNDPTSDAINWASSKLAESVINVPAGNIVATDVQAALNELDTEKAKLAGLATQQFLVAKGTATDDAVNFDQAFGLGQTYQDFTASRAIGQLYYNTTDKPIAVAFHATGSTIICAPYGLVDGVKILGAFPPAVGGHCSVQFVVQPGNSYKILAWSGTLTILSWDELV